MIQYGLCRQFRGLSLLTSGICMDLLASSLRWSHFGDLVRPRRVLTVVKRKPVPLGLGVLATRSLVEDGVAVE